MNNFYKKFRGSPELIRKRLTPYVAYFKDCHNVLDLGCGRGEFLGLLKEAGIKAVGVDIDPDMIMVCRDAGYDVVQGDIFEYLSDNQGYDGIMASQLIEHMRCDQAEALLKNCYGALKLGGIIIFVTPNPENLQAITKTFWLDPTHIRPYPLGYIVELTKSMGFDIVACGDAPLSRSDGIRAVFGRIFLNPIFWLLGLDQLRSALFSGHDIFIVGKKGMNNRRD